MARQPQISTSGRVARTLTLLTTFSIKMVGVAAAFNQLLLVPNPKAISLMTCAFMMAGAQFSEGLILSFLDRMMPSASEGETHAPTRHDRRGTDR